MPNQQHTNHQSIIICPTFHSFIYARPTLLPPACPPLSPQGHRQHRLPELSTIHRGDQCSDTMRGESELHSPGRLATDLVRALRHDGHILRRQQHRLLSACDSNRHRGCGVLRGHQLRSGLGFQPASINGRPTGESICWSLQRGRACQNSIDTDTAHSGLDSGQRQSVYGTPVAVTAVTATFAPSAAVTAPHSAPGCEQSR